MTKAMLYTDLDPASLPGRMMDNRFVLQQKVDGTRAIADLTGSAPRWVTRNGTPLKHSAATQHLRLIEEHLPNDPMILDGEVMILTGEYLVFDLIECPHLGISRASSQRERREALEQVLAPVPSDSPVRLLPEARTVGEKRRLLHEVRRLGGEGVMVKDRTASYDSATRVRHSQRFKFVKDADVIVTSVTRSRNDAGREIGSIQYAVHAPNGSLVHVGACSVIGKPHVEPGDVIEVAYLYWTGTVTYQPRMVRVREDKAPEECTLDQFQPYSREVATLP